MFLAWHFRYFRVADARIVLDPDYGESLPYDLGRGPVPEVVVRFGVFAGRSFEVLT